MLTLLGLGKDLGCQPRHQLRRINGGFGHRKSLAELCDIGVMGSKGIYSHEMVNDFYCLASSRRLECYF